jgi:OOP family OmpA-OmpF porin
MKKHLLAVLATSAFAFPLAAQAAGAYVGASVGSVEHKLTVDGDAATADKTGAKLLAGYGFTDHFGIELGYAHLGRLSASASDGINSASLSYKAQVLYLAGTATLPLGSQFSLFAKGGVTANHAKGSVTLNGNNKNGRSGNATGMFGVGAAYSVTPALAIVAEYENFGKVLDKDEAHTKAQMVSVGLRYKF